MDDSNGNNKKLIIGGVVLLLLLMAVFIYALNQFTKTNDGTTDQVITTLPEGGERAEEVAANTDTDYVPLPTNTADIEVDAVTSELLDTVPDELKSADGVETDWRQDVITYSNTEEVTTSQPPVIPTEVGTYDPVDDFLETDYSQLYQPPSYITLGNGTVVRYEDLATPESFAKALQVFPSLSNLFGPGETCGSLTLSTKESAAEDFYNDLSSYEEMVCLGEAVADGCSYAWTDVQISEDITTTFYVGEREDGVCSAGVRYNSESHIVLCGLDGIMNSTASNSKTPAEWQAYFEKEPGEAISKLFNITEPIDNELDCKIYEI